MLDKVLLAIKEYNMLVCGETVTVALSGGADSVSLLYSLLALKKELGINIKAAHLNHSLRGKESDSDEAFVRKLCDSLGVELICERVFVKAEADKSKESIELCARRLRYEFLERVSESGVVATAHTASDSLETVLLNITRGTALKGLCGIPAKRGIFIRPLIWVTRAEVEDYCKKNNITFVNDSTNAKDEYTRNKIRHNVIPVLKDINESIENTVLRTSKILKEDNDCLDDLALAEFQNRLTDDAISINGLNGVHTAIKKRVVKYFLEHNGIESFSINIDSVINILSGGKVVMPGGVALVCENGTLKTFAEEKPLEFITEFSVVNAEEFENLKKVNNLLLKNTLDYDKIIGEFHIRSKKAGDKLRIWGRGVTKTLKKLCTENAVDNRLRQNLPVIADDEGVIWAYSFGISERVKPDINTKNFMVIKSELKN